MKKLLYSFAVLIFVLGVVPVQAQEGELSALEELNAEAVKQTEVAKPKEAGQQTDEVNIDLGDVRIKDDPDLLSVLDEAQMSPEERQRIVEEQARELAFDAAINGLLPLKPGEIRRLLQTYDESTEAAQTPLKTAPKPEVTVQTVSLDPGVAPPIIKVAPGHVTTLSMLDMSGEPWSIQDVSWGGDFDILQPEEGGHVIRISPLGAFKRGNLSIRLVELKTPVTFMLQTHQDVVQYRFDARIPEYGPNASIPIIQQGGIEAVAGSTSLLSVLDGVAPGRAQRMNVQGVDGRTSAYVLDGQIYLRTPHTLLSPAWDNSISSGDGLTVYTIPETPVILLSDNGRMVRASISEGQDL